MRQWICVLIGAMSCVCAMAQGSVVIGKVSYVEGEAFCERSGKTARKLTVNTRVHKGDRISTATESILELTLVSGTVLRFAENTQGVLDEGMQNGNVRMNAGKLWANVQKMQKGGFSVSTPVATAAVRGTVFRVDTDSAGGSVVALYEGIVDVGPSDSTQIKAAVSSGGWGPPVEVPGPYEVTLEEWVRLEPGKQIHVQNSGRFATGDIDPDQDRKDRWVELNRSRDRLVKR